MSQSVHVSARLLASVIDEVRKCGRGREECVVYITSKNDRPREAVGFIHPQHSSSPVSTQVSRDELSRVWDKLRDTNQRIVCQLHSHPGTAFHSNRDDELPVVHSVGFLSIVLPVFGRAGMDGAHLAVYEGAGNWLAVPQEQWPEFLEIDHV